MQETVTLETTLGNIEIELFRDKAPISVENFIDYVNGGFYDGTIIHRIVPDYVIQAGGLDAELSEKPTRPPIKSEADNGLRNEQYAVSMGRDKEPDSATSHFFINLKHNEKLDHGTCKDGVGYAVFGKVISGEDTIERMKAAETKAAVLEGIEFPTPAEPIVILKAYFKRT